MGLTSRNVVACHQCAFWVGLNARDGTCRRHAPRPGDAIDEVAHWPLTHHDDQCGDSAVAGAAVEPRVTCSECIYWRTSGGLAPYKRREQWSEWWAHAGHCTRFAPYPMAATGYRAFWRVTHATDSCCDGAIKAPTMPGSAEIDRA